MSRQWHKVAASALGVAVLIGCSTPGPAPVEERRDIPDYYEVVWGDTLLEIAIRYGLDYQDLAAWNRLKSPDRIYVGQRLRLKGAGAPVSRSAAQPPRVAATKPEPTPASPVSVNRSVNSNGSVKMTGDLTWRWPTDGVVERNYQPNVPGGKGIQISGKLGQSVRAASNGEVVYNGSGLPGYGRLIIVKHSDTYLSAYGYLGKVFVKEGEKVETGQTIAELGASNENRPALHFEIRQDGKPVDPLRFLPS